MRTEFDTLVIGGGFAGLAAARELARQGQRVVLLEARGRLGGRAQSVGSQSFDLPVELGAEFIHGTHNPVWEVLSEARIPVYEVTDRHSLWTHSRGRSAMMDCPDFWDRLDGVLMKARPFGRILHPDRPFLELLGSLQESGDISPEDAQLARSFIEGFHAADPRCMSERSVALGVRAAQKTEGNRSFRLIGGFGRLIDWYRSELESLGVAVELGAPVKQIGWKQGEVRVDTEKACFTAGQAILTMPASIWNLDERSPGHIRIVPELPEKRKAFSKLRMGPVCKVVLTFRERFWDKAPGGAWRDFSFIHEVEHGGLDFPTVWSASPVLEPRWTLWAGGPFAEKLLDCEADDLRLIALEQVAEMTERPLDLVRRQLVSLHFHDWQKDPFSRGAYSYLVPGGVADQKHLADPIADTLFFAGEATETNSQTGTVDAAIGTGLRAARQVAQRGRTMASSSHAPMRLAG